MIEIPRRSSLCVALAALALACGGESGGPGVGAWRAAVDTVGDTITVRTVSGSVWGDTATLVAEVTIGVLEGADEYLLGDPVAIAVGPDGVIYAPDGTHLRGLGREGGGPGEYRQPRSLAVLPDGRVPVRDRGNARNDVFDPDGEYVTEWPVMSSFGTRRRFYADTAGNSYVTSLAGVGLPPWEWRYSEPRLACPRSTPSPFPPAFSRFSSPGPWPRTSRPGERVTWIRLRPYVRSEGWAISQGAEKGAMAGGGGDWRVVRATDA